MTSDMAEERDEVLLYYKPRDNLPYCELINLLAPELFFF